MTTYICILRGINVSGHKMIKMDALKELFSKLKYKNVRTYIQSGNVIFQFDKTETKQLEAQIAKQINIAFGFDVPVLVREAGEFKKVFENNPFVNKRKEDISKLHVTFLSEQPDKVKVEAISGGDYGRDEFIVTGNVIFLFCPDGYGNTKLNNNFFENKLKVTATTRNWKTITELITLAGVN